MRMLISAQTGEASAANLRERQPSCQAHTSKPCPVAPALVQGFFLPQRRATADGVMRRQPRANGILRTKQASASAEVQRTWMSLDPALPGGGPSIACKPARLQLRVGIRQEVS